MYRDKMWTMRQFLSMGNATQTNERYHFLVNAGQEKQSSQLDGWLSDGSPAYVDSFLSRRKDR